MPISNRDRFPDVDFFKDSDIKRIGDIGGTALVQVGKQQGTDELVVAKAYTSDPTSEDLFAVPLYELLNHSQDTVNITGS